MQNANTNAQLSDSLYTNEISPGLSPVAPSTNTVEV